MDIAIRGTLVSGPPETRALLVVDQFEELFTLCADQSERRQFVAALLDAAHGPDRRTTVVLGVRADFLTQFAQHPDLLDALGEDARLLVGPMSAGELREIVVRPAAHAGWGVEPDMLATVLADAAEEPGALPLVSHALLETWHRRTGASLTLSAYQASGGVRGAIAQTADRVYSELTGEQQQAARRIFKPQRQPDPALPKQAVRLFRGCLAVRASPCGLGLGEAQTFQRSCAAGDFGYLEGSTES
jgi:hypothetical protein